VPPDREDRPGPRVSPVPRERRQPAWGPSSWPARLPPRKSGRTFKHRVTRSAEAVSPTEAGAAGPSVHPRTAT